MRMSWTRTVAPAAEPVNLDEAKAHLRVDVTDDDVLISRLIQAAREYVEEATGRALINQTWRLSLDDWPEGDYIELPRPPLSSVTSVVYTDSDATAHTFSTSYYDVDTDSEPGRVVLEYGDDWPSATLATMNPIVITYIAGYGATSASVPEHLRQAILLLIGHWYENREGMVIGQGLVPITVPYAIQSLIMLNKVNFWR